MYKNKTKKVKPFCFGEEKHNRKRRDEGIGEAQTLLLTAVECVSPPSVCQTSKQTKKIKKE